MDFSLFTPFLDVSTFLVTWQSCLSSNSPYTCGVMYTSHLNPTHPGTSSYTPPICYCGAICNLLSISVFFSSVLFAISFFVSFLLFLAPLFCYSPFYYSLGSHYIFYCGPNSFSDSGLASCHLLSQSLPYGF